MIVKNERLKLKKIKKTLKKNCIYDSKKCAFDTGKNKKDLK